MPCIFKCFASSDKVLPITDIISNTGELMIIINSLDFSEVIETKTFRILRHKDNYFILSFTKQKEKRIKSKSSIITLLQPQIPFIITSKYKI